MVQILKLLGVELSRLCCDRQSHDSVHPRLRTITGWGLGRRLVVTRIANQSLREGSRGHSLERAKCRGINSIAAVLPNSEAGMSERPHYYFLEN